MAIKNCIACSEEILESAKLCKHCGILQDDQRFSGGSEVLNVKKSKEKPGAVSSAKHLCPKCGKSDSVSSVAAIVDGGTSTSASFSMMSQIGHPMNMYSGVSVGASASNLASRLSIGYPEPRFRYFLALLGGFVVSMWILNMTIFQSGGVWDSGDSTMNLFQAGFISLFTGPIIGIIFGFIDKAEQRRKLIPVQLKVAYATESLRSAYYCSRDDLVFKGKKSGSPERFIEDLLR
jgi:hypothetical protein